MIRVAAVLASVVLGSLLAMPALAQDGSSPSSVTSGASAQGAPSREEIRAALRNARTAGEGVILCRRAGSTDCRPAREAMRAALSDLRAMNPQAASRIRDRIADRIDQRRGGLEPNAAASRPTPPQRTGQRPRHSGH